MLIIRKKGFKIQNGDLQQKYDIQMKKTNKGYNIVGYNNEKIIDKHVRYFNKNTKLAKKPKKTKKTKKKK